MRFTVRRPPTGEVSPCCHRPSSGDVACGVDVGVAPPSITGIALEDRLALAVLGSDVPAHGASLRRVRRRDLLDPTVSLVLQTRGEKTPTASVYSSVQPPLLSNVHAGLLNSSPCTAGHRAHVKGFDADRVEAPRDVSGGLFDPVLAPVGLTRSQFRDRLFRSGATVGATFGPGKSLLQRLQPLGLSPAEAGCVQRFAGRQCGRHDHAAVDTDHAVVARTADWFGDVSEYDMPAASPIAGDAAGLHFRGHRTRQPKTHPPDLGHPDPPEAAVQARDVTRLDRDLPKPLMHTGLAPLRATMCTAVKVSHGLCEIPQCLLLHRLTPGTKPRVLGAAPPSIAPIALRSREPCDPAASAVVALPPNSTHTAHPGNAPSMPPPAQRWAATGTGP